MTPALLVMAAGMGSRYGGLKQIDPIGPNGEVIIDYSLYDAKKAGFNDVYFIIKHEIEDDFKAVIKRGIAKHFNVHYLYQEIDKIPEGIKIPEERKKPWGTGHAILMAKDEIKVPFAIINADDYYGPDAFKSMYEYLSGAQDKEKYDYCMIGYRLKNTLTANGFIARGVCEEDSSGSLKSIVERKKIKLNSGKIQFTEDDGQTWEDLDPNTLVSMNMFGFTPSIMNELSERFPKALLNIISNKPETGEFLIPEIVGELLSQNLATVKVLPSKDRWYGVTYKEDKPVVIDAMKEKLLSGEYPKTLW